MERINRLTEKSTNYDFYFPKKKVSILDLSNKLGKLENLEEELGCPLEVVFEALKEGIYCVDYDNQKIRKFIAPLFFNSTSKQFYWYGNNIGYPDLKDYKKTWWLPSDKEWRNE